jgi:hypothetical protein
MNKSDRRVKGLGEVSICVKEWLKMVRLIHSHNTFGFSPSV